MSIGVLVVGSLLIAGCSRGQPQKTYYQLPVSVDRAVEKPVTLESQLGAKHEPQLWIKSVDLSDYLAAPGIVYQTGKVSYVNASNHLWASPLQQQLQQALIAELSAAFPNRLVADQQLEKEADALNMTITAFHGRYDGQVLIGGYWILANSDRVIKQPFDMTLKQEKDGYADLVLTLSKGYRQLAKSIARQLYLQP
nr:membrane integrity-associated transporter subunit PqiC [Xenorhabdus poinarii]